jgi:general secretion pathway protein M
MNVVGVLRKTFVGSPLLAATVYVALVISLLFAVIISIAGLVSQRAEVASSAAMLEQLEGHATATGRKSADADMRSGSPFLEGATVTVAGAALIQRVAGSVTKFGGSVLSSQLELKGPHAKAGFLSILVSCEIDQSGLQKLLYDLEAGMPFLFVDQLTVQAPTSASSSASGKLRTLLAVSGQWQETKK